MVIQRVRKGSMKIAYYLILMKAYADNLSLTGSPETKELIICVTRDLDEEYTPIAVVIQNMKMTWNEV